MKNELLYNKTVDILVQAYFDDTLQHGNCWACAVGNLVVANTGDEFVDSCNWRKGFPCWDDVFSTTTNGVQIVDAHRYYGDTKLQIDSTGYTWQELAKIENAFETAAEGNSDEDYMFNGLMAVIDALDKIHENKMLKQQNQPNKNSTNSLHMNYIEELAEVFKGVTLNYNGCKIECLKDKFIVFREEFKTLEEAKAKVDEAFNNLKKSIK